MKLKQLALLATLMVAGQSWALTPYEMLHSCDHFSGNCPDQNGGGGGGGGISNEASSYDEAFIYDGQLWEVFHDSKGSFVIQTDLSTKKKTVTQGNYPTAYMIKSAPPTTQMRRSALVLGDVTTAMTVEQAKKKKAAEEKAQAAAAAQKAQADALAAKKAAEAKVLAEAVQKAGGVGAYSAGLSGPMSAQKPASLNEITARTKP